MASESILKNSNQATGPNITERHRQLALQHATIIQQRKDMEAVILESLEELIDFPSSRNASPSRPSPADIAAFRKHIAPFAVSDYDDLIEERNATGKCGYLFCPRRYKRDAASTAKVRLVWGSRNEPVREVPGYKFPKWCGRECARKAMFIKVQLNEHPVWERGGVGNKVLLLRDNDEQILEARLKHSTAQQEEEKGLKDAMAELALERGEREDTSRFKAIISDPLRERTTEGVVEPPQASDEHNSLSSASVEGHTPGHFHPKLPLRAKEEQGRDMDWDLA